MNYLLGASSLLSALALICAYCRFWGYNCGLKDGYQQGRKDAEEWIVKLETDVDQARQEIWRQES